MKTATKIKSTFALLDVLGVTRCRSIDLRLKKDGSIPVVIRGRIKSTWGNFDGTSQEFEISVDSVEEMVS